ncbi:PLAT/LH2 domain-containing protein [Geodermatophilus sp. SYSU D00758]
MPFDSYEEQLRQIHRYAVREGFVHGWPNFEQGMSPDQGLVYGAYFLRPGQSWEIRDVYRHEIAGSPWLSDIEEVWRGVSRWAYERGYVTGVPIFEAGDHGQGVFYPALLLKPGAYIEYHEPYQDELDGQPDFRDPGAVVRAVNRWFARRGFAGGIPNFEAGDRGDGRGVFYGAFGLRADQHLVAHDVPDSILTGIPATAFEVWIKTADIQNAGTDRTVSLTLFGEFGTAGPRALNDLISHDAFERGSQEWVTLDRQPRLGRVYKIKLETDRHLVHLDADWRLEAVEVTPRYPSDPPSYFRVDDWITPGTPREILAENWPTFEGGQLGRTTTEDWLVANQLDSDFPKTETVTKTHNIASTNMVSMEITDSSQLSLSLSAGWQSSGTRLSGDLRETWTHVVTQRSSVTLQESLTATITHSFTYPAKMLTLVRFLWTADWALSLARLGVTTFGARWLDRAPQPSWELGTFSEGELLREPFATYVRDNLPHLAPRFQF